MSSMIAIILLHSFERIVSVALGGLAIYFGYRLFLVLPMQTQSDGKIKLPGMDVVLTKAGPGIFFLAFGTLVVMLAIMRGPKYKHDGEDHGEEYSGFSPAKALDRGAVNEQSIARIQLTVQSINCMQRLANQTTKALSGDLQHAARDAKFALLAGAWNTEEWGSIDTFERWLKDPNVPIPNAAKSVFEGSRSDCPN